MGRQHIIISVDGPAASGKSTIARSLASALNFKYINSGALYRAIGWHLLDEGVAAQEGASLARALSEIEFGVREGRYYLNGADVTDRLHTRDASVQASVVARLPAVREKVNGELRRLAEDEECVVEGRDIGSVVFPDSDLKVYLEASLEERAKRRLRDYEKVEPGRSLEEISRELADRDSIDSTRAIAPLRTPDDAVIVNSTHMTPEQVINHLLTLFKERRGAPTGASEGSGEGGLTAKMRDKL